MAAEIAPKGLDFDCGTVAGHMLPWHVEEPYKGCNGRIVHDSVWDADGVLVCECEAGDEGKAAALAIAKAVNQTGPKICAYCGKPATCFGSYEGLLVPAYACDECCAHGNEDGHCERLAPETT